MADPVRRALSIAVGSFEDPGRDLAYADDFAGRLREEPGSNGSTINTVALGRFAGGTVGVDDGSESPQTATAVRDGALIGFAHASARAEGTR